jgi:hypothetical protein
VNRIFRRKAAQTGFTLIEVLISMFLFIVIMMVASNAFKKIITQSSKYSKMEESNIEGIIGLEIMRHDLEQTGFGLPWGWGKTDGTTPPQKLITDNVTISYLEAVEGPAALNDFNRTSSDPSHPEYNYLPRAVTGSAILGQFTSAYMAVKGSTLGVSKASQRWTHIPFHNYSANPWQSRPVVLGSNTPITDDVVVMITSNFNNANLDHLLIIDPGNSTKFSQDFTSSASMDNNFLPLDDLQTYMVYGIRPKVADSSDPLFTKLRMPFNRSDFFIKVPTAGDGGLPPFCEKSRTGVLYKGTVNHGDGKYTYIPLMDCVANMQVVFGWNRPVDCPPDGRDLVFSNLPKPDGKITTSNTDARCLNPITGYFNDPKLLRENLRIIKVYILAQEGKRDASYTAPNTTVEVGDIISDSVYPKMNYVLSPEQQHYRWKLYRMVVRPKNLSANQK